MVVAIGSVHDFDTKVTAGSSTMLVVVDFFADWCQPCRNAAPLFQALTHPYPAPQPQPRRLSNSGDIFGKSYFVPICDQFWVGTPKCS